METVCCFHKKASRWRFIRQWLAFIVVYVKWYYFTNTFFTLLVPSLYLVFIMYMPAAGLVVFTPDRLKYSVLTACLPPSMLLTPVSSIFSG